MTLIGEEGIRVAILPIGDNYTMGPEDAIRATNLSKPEVVVPVHYNTFALIEQDVELWAEKTRALTQARPVVLDPGECFELM